MVAFIISKLMGLPEDFQNKELRYRGFPECRLLASPSITQVILPENPLQPHINSVLSSSLVPGLLHEIFFKQN